MEIRWHTCAGRLPVRRVCLFFLCFFFFFPGIDDDEDVPFPYIVEKSQNHCSRFSRASSSSSSSSSSSMQKLCFRGRMRRAFARFSDPLSLSLSLVYRRLAFLTSAKKKYVV
jgi:hypothetical protein